MTVSQRGQYALRALFELAKHYGRGPVSVAEIAEAQAIPPRFLEVVLQQLRQAGYVQSRRGAQGGYVLKMKSGEVTVADVLHCIEGNLSPVGCMLEDAENSCRLQGRCAFLGLWQRAAAALEAVYRSTTLQDLLDEERDSTCPDTLEYTI